jgi:3-methylfumaryl-CoA hydratase
MTQKTNYENWIGSSERLEEEISLAPAQGLAATLDDRNSTFQEGDPLPPLWQWLYFLPRVPQSEISPDGHPQRGGFLPPVELPRRMFAGARMQFRAPLLIGRPALREGTVLNVQEKRGKSGSLVFVTVRYLIRQQDQVCIEEEQDIVYREQGAPMNPPVSVDWPPAPENSWVRTVTPDSVLLFRFSALTFNAHRIHYDRPYATGEEGYPGLVVHGPLTAIQLMELVRHNTARPVVYFTFRGQAPLFDLAPYRLIGTLTADDAVTLEAQGPDARTTLTATAALG